MERSVPHSVSSSEWETSGKRVARILVVEDDADIAALIGHYLEKAGHRIDRLSSGSDVLPRLRRAPPDLVVLDLMLPGRNGLEVLREVRASPATSDLPIMVLTARSAEMDRLLGFEHGADDYLTKPFSPRELVARLRALLRRTSRGLVEGTVEVGPLRVDSDAHEATCEGRRLDLTPREFELLVFLVRHPGRVMSREELLRKVWGYGYVGETRTVAVHVGRLRAKLGPAAHLIETVQGVGYKLAGPRPAAA